MGPMLNYPSTPKTHTEEPPFSDNPNLKVFPEQEVKSQFLEILHYCGRRWRLVQQAPQHLQHGTCLLWKQHSLQFQPRRPLLFVFQSVLLPHLASGCLLLLILVADLFSLSWVLPLCIPFYLYFLQVCSFQILVFFIFLTLGMGDFGVNFVIYSANFGSCVFFCVS